MKAIRITLIVGLLYFTLPAVVNGQQPSREELLKEAGRLATEAEQKQMESSW